MLKDLGQMIYELCWLQAYDTHPLAKSVITRHSTYAKFLQNVKKQTSKKKINTAVIYFSYSKSNFLMSHSTEVVNGCAKK